MKQTTWTVEAYNPHQDAWQRLPVSRATKTEALRLAACISVDHFVRTRVVRG